MYAVKPSIYKGLRERATFYGIFWVGIYERSQDGRLEACKITFGPEPKDYEVYEFLLQNWSRLPFSPPVEAEEKTDKKGNPKRMQREIKKQLETQGIGTKAQQALKLWQEQGKKERKTKSRMEREAEKERKYDLHQEKRKKKHRGH